MLHGAAKISNMPAILDTLQVRLEQEGLAPHSVDVERGAEQYEVALLPSAAALCASRTARLHDVVTDWAKEHGLSADFSAKPAADQPGNGLHIHIDLIRDDMKSAYFKQDDSISDTLKYSIGGLLQWMLPSMAAFAPNEASYARFVARNNAPITVSWGANNRTVALRLPDANDGLRHIEHRVAGSDANPEHVIALILAAIHDGLKQRYNIPEQIYGDAALEEYNLPRFPSSLSVAQQMMSNSPYATVIQQICH